MQDVEVIKTQVQGISHAKQDPEQVLEKERLRKQQREIEVEKEKL